MFAQCAISIIPSVCINCTSTVMKKIQLLIPPYDSWVMSWGRAGDTGILLPNIVVKSQTPLAATHENKRGGWSRWRRTRKGKRRKRGVRRRAIAPLGRWTHSNLPAENPGQLPASPRDPRGVLIYCSDTASIPGPVTASPIQPVHLLSFNLLGFLLNT